ncbi:MAG: hypothetical protein ACRBB4_11095 [Neptuniibacter sp.]
MNKIACKGKYYKIKNAEILLNHINRTFKNNLNTYPHLTNDNFGNKNLVGTFHQIKSKAEEQKRSTSPNNPTFKKNSNLLLDNVLILSRKRTDLIIKKIGIEKFQKLITRRINQFGREVQQEFGLTYLGFNFHMDEGHGHNPDTDPTEIHDQNQIKNNYHAHCEFFNFDFTTNKQPLRTLDRQSGFTSKLQDLAYKHFKDLGYTRGTPKKTKLRDKTSKADYLERLRAELAQGMKRLKNKQNQLAEHSNHSHTTLEQLIEKIISAKSEAELYQLIGSKNAKNLINQFRLLVRKQPLSEDDTTYSPIEYDLSALYQKHSIEGPTPSEHPAPKKRRRRRR